MGPITNIILGNSSQYLDALLRRLLLLGSPIDEIATNILTVISTSTAELSQSTSHTSNYDNSQIFIVERSLCAHY